MVVNAAAVAEPVIVGVADDETVPLTIKSLPVWNWFRYQEPELADPPQTTSRNVTVVEDETFCRAEMLLRVTAD